MLLIKFDGKFPITVKLPNTYKVVMHNQYIWADADIDFYTFEEIVNNKIVEITDSNLIEAINMCDHSFHTDDTIRLYGSGLNFLSPPLDYARLDRFMVGAKYFAKLKAKEDFDKKFSSLHHRESTLEEATWAQQLAEAKALLASPTADVPLISVLAAVNGQEVGQFAGSIVDADNAYKTALGNLLTQLHNEYAAIDAATTPKSLKDTGWI